jgi:signal transduction histidine kinase
VVHDLRAPLVIITGSLSLVKDGKLGELNPKQVEWLNKSLETVNFVAELTDNLFEMSKLEAGAVSLHSEATDLEELLHQIYDTGAGLPWTQAVSFDLNISSPLPEAHIDPLRIRQILMNLVGNAHKFTEMGSVTVHACYIPDQQEIQIGVADTGEGIPLNKHQTLFDRFQQVDTNVARRQSGAGLGLAICRELVEMHNGRIWVKSELGIGSNFIFTLPIKPLYDGEDA